MSMDAPDRKYYIYPEDDLPWVQIQIHLRSYFFDLVEFMYEVENWFYTGNLEIFPPDDTYPFRSLVPDFALFKGVVLSPDEQAVLSHWKIDGSHRPPPTVVVEVSSHTTWKNDLDPKPEHYRLLGVKEYIAFDPLKIWHDKVQLRVWRYTESGKEELVPDERGWIWSEVLESWLVPDDAYLRFYDRNGHIRLTSVQAINKETALIQAAREKAEAVTQAERAAREKAEAITQAIRAAREKAEAEAERVIREKAEVALQKLLKKLNQQDYPKQN